MHQHTATHFSRARWIGSRPSRASATASHLPIHEIPQSPSAAVIAQGQHPACRIRPLSPFPRAIELAKHLPFSRFLDGAAFDSRGLSAATHKVTLVSSSSRTVDNPYSPSKVLKTSLASASKSSAIVISPFIKPNLIFLGARSLSGRRRARGVTDLAMTMLLPRAARSTRLDRSAGWWKSGADLAAAWIAEIFCSSLQKAKRQAV